MPHVRGSSDSGILDIVGLAGSSVSSQAIGEFNAFGRLDGAILHFSTEYDELSTEPDLIFIPSAFNFSRYPCLN